ncbi:MAG: rRNA pseudouridine synthase [Peptococcaceae bacterium]|nr:rRNA pseudouridine synthase [Peptococcaceae bacterium]
MAQAGIASRRKCEELILAGRVTVNGKITTTLGTKVDPDKDEIRVDGKVIRKEPHIYLVLYKPPGYVTTVHDPQNRPTVMTLVRDYNQRIYPVGRLDYDTEGLLLMTNDGDFAYRLTHPKHHVPKTYLATVSGIPNKKALTSLRQGVKLEDGLTSPAKVQLVKKGTDSVLLKITLYEGRNRQVRRMCGAVGHPVLHLKRTSIGNLSLEGLKPGQYRTLTTEEVVELKNLVGLK